ncbi:hypothetical protein DL93DRAFT_715496 [Clavulina sp. PMI_390]|nr:hypothetical protein DL93DRAFT_715496 [Clavulina sp. PMI_390]
MNASTQQHSEVLTLDILPYIFGHVSSTADLYNLCLASRSASHYALNRLYDGTLFAQPMADAQAKPNRRYAKALQAVIRYPHLASRVRSYIVPHMPQPHERFDELWSESFSACHNITEFHWRSTSAVPPAVLSGLSEKPRLRSLTIPGDELSIPSKVDAVTKLPNLEQLSLLAPDRAFRHVFAKWMNSMNETLTRLHVESAEWLDDSILSVIRLPNLVRLTLHDCPALSAAGVLPLLRSASKIQTLYLGLSGVKLSELARPDDHGPRPTFNHLQKVFVNWEKSLAFWLHLQSLLEASPIETFHIIRASAVAKPRRSANDANVNQQNGPPTMLAPIPNMQQNVAQNANVGGNAPQGAPAVNGALATRPANLPPVLVLLTSIVETLTPYRISFALPPPRRETPLIDDSFIHRFVSLHATTLKKFWVVGLRCSEEAVFDMCSKCEQLERVKAEDVDEFPMIRRPTLARDMASRKSLWSWWRDRNAGADRPLWAPPPRD